MDLYVHFGESGLLIGDLSLRVYIGDELTLVPALSLLTLSTGVDYTIENIPDISDIIPGYTLTAETPLGIWHAWRFGTDLTRPERAIIPIRDSGLVIGDLGIAVFNDGTALDNGDLTLMEIGPAGGGDYSLFGWDLALFDERWSVRWNYAGITYAHSWVGVVPDPVSGSYYIEILSVQEPFAYNVDGDNRTFFSCNYYARGVAPIVNFEGEIAKIISNAGLGTFNTDLFIGPRVVIPTGDGPYTLIINTGGRSPDEAHGTTSSPGTKYKNLGFQILVRAADYQIAQTRANSINNLLDGKRSFTIAA